MTYPVLVECEKCGDPFTKAHREGTAKLCRKCRMDSIRAMRAAAAAERNRLKQLEHAKIRMRAVRAERTELTPKERDALRREQRKAGMVKRTCAKCPRVYVTRPGATAPPLCPQCALASLPPLDVRWGHEHVLCKA